MKQFNLVRNLEQFVRYFPIFKINLLFFIRCETSACLHATIYLWFTAPRGKGHLFWKKKRSLIYAKKQEQEQHRPIPLGRTTNDSKYCRGQFRFKRSFSIFGKSINSSIERDSHNSISSNTLSLLLNRLCIGPWTIYTSLGEMRFLFCRKNAI